MDSDLEAIRLYLKELPQETSLRFEFLFDEARKLDDFRQIEHLLQAIEPLALPYLEQWLTYTRAYLALEANSEVAEAITLLESLRIQRQILAPNLVGRVFNSLGIAYEINEQWDRATLCYQECIELCETAGDQLGLGKALGNLAVVHYKASDYPAAVTYASRSVALLKQQPDNPAWRTVLGNSLNELGLALLKLERLNEARAALEASLAIDLEQGRIAGQATSYNNLGHVYRQLGDITTAECFYTQARDNALAAGYLREAAEAIYGLGLLQLSETTSASSNLAEVLFDEALQLAQVTNNHEITTEIHLRQAELSEKLDDPVTALAETRRAVETVESLRANIVLPEDRTRLQGSRIEAYEQMVFRLCQLGTPSTYAEALYYAEMAKSRALVELLAGQPLRLSERVPQALLDQAAQLRQILYGLYADPASNSQQVANLERELNQLRQRIRLQDAEFESFQTVSPLSAGEIMARLPEEAVLLEYFTVGPHILAFVVTPDDIKVTQLPLTLSDLAKIFERAQDGKLGQLRYLLPGPDHRLRQPWLLNQLYQRLVEPLGEAIRSASFLYIIPHNLLHYLPFHALYWQGNAGQEYLTGSEPHLRQIVYGPSATTLLDYCQGKAPSPHQGCLAVGYNDLAANLSQAELEADRIAQLTDGFSLTGPAARRETIFQQAGNYRYLHFSCHGRFNPNWPLTSGLSLADSWLDVTDVLQELRLEADLVSLSACETGRSQVLRGDELVGLTRAFLYAGAPSVLVSHWTVNELATRLLMERFYRELLTGSTQLEKGYRARALSQAQNFIRKLTLDELHEMLLADYGSPAAIEPQLRYLASSAGYSALESLSGSECLLTHPYYWSPFFLIGDQ